jgi:hypothetical protein
VTAAGVASGLDAFLRDVSTLSNANAASNVPLLGNLTLPAGTGFFDQLRADIASALSGVADAVFGGGGSDIIRATVNDGLDFYGACSPVALSRVTG